MDHSSLDGNAVKLCKDCKHYGNGMAGVVCWHPKNRSLVDGSPLKYPTELRYSSYSGSCQERGYWWEAKELQCLQP